MPLIRPAIHADLAVVAAIFAHYVTSSVATFETTPPTEQDWEQKHADLTARGLPFLVADVDGEVAGYAYAAPWRPKPAYHRTAEDSIYLHPERTGLGLGRRLLSALVQDCAGAGLEQLIAVIADDSHASVSLHRAFGFTDAGRLRAVGHKHGRVIDTLLMQCDLRGGVVAPGSYCIALPHAQLQLQFHNVL
ncbi:MAG TPA: GNAT family N-acetyltransferase [Trebonia sp.]|nr:GNAT family N-acetyltransferase [Trebonia sp.]